MDDTWTDRDLPVLDATLALLEQSFMVTVTDIAARTGLDVPVVATALEALDPVYVDFRKTTTGGDPRFWYVFKATPEARRAVGQWPTAESLATRLAAELVAEARAEPDAERQGLLAYAARLVGETLRDATVRAAGRILAPAFGGVPVPEFGKPVPEPEPEPEPEPYEDYPSLVELPELPELLRRTDSETGRSQPAAGGPTPAGGLRPLPEADRPDPAAESRPDAEQDRPPEADRPDPAAASGPDAEPDPPPEAGSGGEADAP